LHHWHDRDDEEGVKVWYVRKSLEEAIVALSKNIAKQTEIFQAMHEELRDVRRDLRVIKSIDPGGAV